MAIQMPDPGGNLDRLPKWAQSYIKVLTMRLEEERARNGKFDGETPTRVRLDWYERDQSLPEGEAIRYEMDNGGHIQVLYKGTRLEINCSDGAAFVVPVANNALEIYTTPRF